MDLEQLNRIEAEAIEDEGGAAPADQIEAGGLPAVQNQDQETAAEFAAFLTMAAQMAAAGLNMPTIPQRFNESANMQIAVAAVALCRKYGYDPRAALIGGDSAIGLWLGLGVALAMPSMGLYNDVRLARMKEVKEETPANDNGQQSQQ